MYWSVPNLPMPALYIAKLSTVSNLIRDALYKLTAASNPSVDAASNLRVAASQLVLAWMLLLIQLLVLPVFSSNLESKT